MFFKRLMLTTPILALTSLYAMADTPDAAGKSIAVECGIASWYGHGHRTASGEELDVSAMTAAHKSLPFGTRVLVENLRNGRNVVVRINDRGPFIKGRIVDLSLAAALEVGLTRSGIAPVRLTRLDNVSEEPVACG